jgi:hypothetical protein
VSRIGVTNATSTSKQGPVHADLGALIIAGGRACSTSTRLTQPVTTNETSPHVAETLGRVAG